MTITQEILVAFFKFNYFSVLESSLSERENKLIEKIRQFPAEKSLRIGKSYEGKPVLIWDSDVDRSVACYITESEFLFSQTEVYKTMNGNMKGLVAEHFPRDVEKEQLLKNEIDEIKSIIMSFSVDAEVYFK